MRRAGFTLVELLVACAVIALLCGVAIPALSHARRLARDVVEVAALRQVCAAWTAYAVDNRGSLLPGFRSGLPVAQEDGTPIPADAAGSISELGARYPWRLIPYLGSDFRALYVNENADHLRQLQTDNPQSFYYLTSLYPSFGLNSVWVGGDQSRYGFLPATLPNGSANPLGSFYATRLSGIRHASRVTVFASSRTSASVDGGMREGFFRIEGPRFLASQGSTWGAGYDGDNPASFGNLSTRGGERVAVGTVDGAAEWVPVAEMADMRRWADQATGAEWGIAAEP